MDAGSSNSAFDPDRILEALDRHGVEYVLVGGVAARVHGAGRATADIDCVPATNEENLQRLAGALADLGARLRVGGMSDEEARQLPLRLDAATLAAFGSSTWTTDAGPLDLLVELRDPAGGYTPTPISLRVPWASRWAMSRSAWPPSTTSSLRRNLLDVRRTLTLYPNCRHSAMLRAADATPRRQPLRLHRQ